ncbi:unnamed protein product [Nippostrongylus brasiliensis]|uniref:Uncharacterized protein n=1 Tax=Nippostrongylus brasiliensis TaxID=27835 RepID=A0A0N4YLS9_NIPBR|nr:unnamed protein product [Nippostrongylus brasiliensis]
MFSPSRVVARLAGYFAPDSSPPTQREIATADAFKRVLQDALYGDIELEEDEHLQDSFEDAEEVEWTPTVTTFRLWAPVGVAEGREQMRCSLKHCCSIERHRKLAVHLSLCGGDSDG